MSRTRRLREAVLVLLEEKGTANTVEVFDHLNERFRWGATMNQVGNILAKDPRFAKVGHQRGQFRGSVYSLRLVVVNRTPDSSCLSVQGMKTDIVFRIAWEWFETG